MNDLNSDNTTESEKYKDLKISNKWKDKFRIFDKAGKFNGISYENNQSLNASERRKIGFNIWAFIFASLYYFAKKMHYKGAFILGAGFLFSAILTLIEISIGIGIPSIIYWVIPSAIVASIASYDYFKHITKNEVMWTGFPSVFSNAFGAIVFPIASLLLLLAISGFLNLANIADFTSDQLRKISTKTEPITDIANAVAPSPDNVWKVSTKTDPITDIRTLSAFKVFTINSFQIQALLSCNTPNSGKEPARFEFTFFTGVNASQVKQTAHMGQGRYRINFTSYLRRLGKEKAKEMNYAIQYSNQIFDKLTKIKVNKDTLFTYKFYLTRGEPVVQFSSSDQGLINVLQACRHLK